MNFTINRTLIWIIVALVLAIVAAVTIERLIHDNRKNKLIAQKDEIIAKYRDAPTRIDTVYSVIQLPGIVVIKPVPIETTIYDTILVPYRVSVYDSLFNQGGIKFRWAAKGNLDYISFRDFTFPKETITITRMIDTCYSKTQPLFRWGLYTGITLNSFTKFPGFELGGQVIVKDNFTVSVGGMYMDGLYGNIRLGWLLKK